MDTTIVAKEIRISLKNTLPPQAGYKFSVRTEKFAGGSAITVSIMSAPFYPFLLTVEEDENRYNEYAQVNDYYITEQDDGSFISNATSYTPQGARLLVKVIDILKFRHWDRSDIQSDFFSCNFYCHVEVGQWDKPFTVKAV